MKNYNSREWFIMALCVVSLIIFLLLSSCRTKRVETFASTQTQTNISQSTETQHQSKTESNINHFLDVRKMLSDNTVENWIFFDTSKPIDSVTGTPPIKATLSRQINIESEEISKSETNLKSSTETLNTEVSNLHFEQQTEITDKNENRNKIARCLVEMVAYWNRYRLCSGDILYGQNEKEKLIFSLFLNLYEIIKTSNSFLF